MVLKISDALIILIDNNSEKLKKNKKQKQTKEMALCLNA